jgi:hypothetical protein
MQVTKEKERVKRAMLLPVMAYVLLLRLYGKEMNPDQGFTIFRSTRHFSGFREFANNIQLSESSLTSRCSRRALRTTMFCQIVGANNLCVFCEEVRSGISRMRLPAKGTPESGGAEHESFTLSTDGCRRDTLFRSAGRRRRGAPRRR